MEPGVAGRLFILIILILFSGFFSSAETAFTCLNKIKLRGQAAEGSKRAQLVLSIVSNPSKFLTTILVGNNVVNIAASSLTTTLCISLWGNTYIGVATGVLTLVILLFGEITPKTMATLKAEKFAFAYAPFINLLIIVMTPITFIVSKLSSGLFFILRIDASDASKRVTEDELLTFVDVSHEDGVIESDERAMINNVVDFGDTIAKDVMVPCIKMKCVPDDVTYQDLLAAFREDEYSRMPVYKESIDNIIGIVWAKDILLKYEPSKPFDVKNYIREPYFTYEHKSTRELMEVLREEYKSLAIVLDEYGATAGLITIEDLLEEIVGEIRDEYDTDETDSISVLDDGSYLVAGQTRLDELNEHLNISIESDDYDSIAGHLLNLFGCIPKEGDTVSDNFADYAVTKMDKNRIEAVRIELKEKQPDSDNDLESTHHTEE